MTALQLLALSMPVMAFVFMGAIALVERRFDRAPTSVRGGFATTDADAAVASGYEGAESNGEAAKDTALKQIADIVQHVARNAVRSAR
jgi:hypothetical protein